MGASSMYHVRLGAYQAPRGRAAGRSSVRDGRRDADLAPAARVGPAVVARDLELDVPMREARELREHEVVLLVWGRVRRLESPAVARRERAVVAADPVAV